MSSIVIYTSVYRENADGKCQRAAASFRIKANDMTADKTFESTTRTYGDLWLSNLLILIKNLIAKYATHRTTIKLITGQDVTSKMAGKLERALIDVLKTGEAPSKDRACLAVLKQGRYTARPNDQLYADVLLALWNAYTGPLKVMFTHVFNDKSAETFDLVKQMHKASGSGRHLLVGTNKRRHAVNAPL